MPEKATAKLSSVKGRPALKSAGRFGLFHRVGRHIKNRFEARLMLESRVFSSLVANKLSVQMSHGYLVRLNYLDNHP